MKKAEFTRPDAPEKSEIEFQFAVPEPVAQTAMRSLLSHFPQAEGGLLWALCPPVGPVGRYRLSSPAGDWFVRISSRWGNTWLERHAVQHLINQGVDVNPLLATGLPLAWRESGSTDTEILRMDVRPLIQGRHYDGSLNDLGHLLATLLACHQAFAKYPEAGRIRDAARSRSLSLAKTQRFISEALEYGAYGIFSGHVSWASSCHRWLAEMCNIFDPDLDRQPGAQCLHGEVHQGNVVFTPAGATLVDFEFSVQTYAPPLWDLAYLVQRFCLHDEPTAFVLQQRLNLVTGMFGDGCLPALPRAMRQVVSFLLALTVERYNHQQLTVPLWEYQKFLRLDGQIKLLEDIL